MPNYTFGIATSAKADWLMQSLTKNNQAQEALALNGAGEPVVAHYYQKVNENSFEAIIPTSESTIPEVGDIFTFDGKSYYVSAVTETQSNTDFVKYSLTVKRFVTTNLPATV
ncbi:MAG: hypothetical protein J5746_12220 [Victivallales bacterium]|nr:hypothetical protein [Victivallales bacterium]